MKLKLSAIILAATLALGMTSAMAETQTTSIVVTGNAITSCTPQAANVNFGNHDFNMQSYWLPITVGVECTDANTAWSIGLPTATLVPYTIDGVTTTTSYVYLYKDDESALAIAGTNGINGTGTNLNVPAKLMFSYPGAGHLGVIQATIPLAVVY